MRKVMFIAGLLLFTSGIARATCDRFEVGGGYKYVRVSSSGVGGSVSVITTGTSSTVNLNGWTAEAAVNPACWLGIVANFNGVYASPGGFSVHTYTEEFGPRINLDKSGPINPFVEALFGAGQLGGGGSSVNVFAGEYGGGVDVSIGGPWALRGRIDDEMLHSNGQTVNGLGVAAEIVLKFGGGH